MAQNAPQQNLVDAFAEELVMGDLSLADARRQQAELVEQIPAVAVEIVAVLNPDQGDNPGTRLKGLVEAWQSLVKQGVTLGSTDESLVVVPLKDLRERLQVVLQILEPVADSKPDFSAKGGNT